MTPENKLNAGIYHKTFIFNPIYSPRPLLSLEAWVGIAAYSLRLTDSDGVLFNTLDAGIFR